MEVEYLLVYLDYSKQTLFSLIPQNRSL